jgi:hypothetical protein
MNSPRERSVLAERLVAHFLELPGLRLTTEQTARLLGVDRGMSEGVVGALLDSAFLRRMPDGSIVRSDR